MVEKDLRALYRLLDLADAADAERSKQAAPAPASALPPAAREEPTPPSAGALVLRFGAASIAATLLGSGVKDRRAA